MKLLVVNSISSHESMSGDMHQIDHPTYHLVPDSFSIEIAKRSWWTKHRGQYPILPEGSLDRWDGVAKATEAFAAHLRATYSAFPHEEFTHSQPSTES